MQLLDELSMIYMACITSFAVFSFNQSMLIKILVFIFATFLAAFITGYYHYLKDPAFHQNVFALLAAIVIFTSIYKMETLLRPSWRANSSLYKQSLQISGKVLGDARERARVDKRDTKILRDMWFLVACGIISIGIGFTIWTIDNTYCSTLRRWRHDIGLPWGVLLEGHGWWYVIPSAVNAYLTTI
jgi:dihydroceramidase